MAETLPEYCRWEAATIEKIEKNNMNRVKCPDCEYKMPIFFSNTAECSGVMVSCKGRGCRSIFEIKIKNGKQIK